VTAAEIECVKLLALAMPVLVVLMALLVVWLTGLQDVRENRRRAARNATATGSPAE
jgi:hypothetical protein